VEQLTRRDFDRLTLGEIAERTGLDAPSDPSAAEAEAYRERAYRSYRLDITRRDEWGTATQATEPPDADDGEL
jgi:hypothetical protein